MSHEYEIRRYAAYFRGWCQAFGEHESLTDETSGISWLYSDSQVGFILPARLMKSLHREVLRPRESPVLDIRKNTARIGAVNIVLPAFREPSTLAEITNILDSREETGVYLTSHFMYGTGTRIVTLSNRKPLAIIYKEIGTMRVRLQ